MKHIETMIQELPITPQRRTALRKQIRDHIAGVREMPRAAPAHIEPCDYAPLRRAVVTEAYKRKHAGQVWVAGKDLAFHESQGATKSSVIMTHKFL